jgi:hypothetical protein
MAGERTTREDQGVFAAYGRTMFSVQLFELALLALVHIDQPELPESAGFDEAREQLEALFDKTAGLLRHELEKQRTVPDVLLDEIETAVNTRNTLVHGYLAEYRMRKTLGTVSSGEIVQELVRVRRRFQDFAALLDVARYEITKERGWDLDDLGGLTEEDLRRIAAEAETEER